MKRLLLLLSVAVALVAAPWDGTYGSLSVLTFSYNNQLTGVPHLSAETVWYTEFLLHSADSTVSAFRVKITYADDSGVHTAAQTSDVQPSGYSLVIFQAKTERVTAVSVTPLRDDPTQPLPAK